MPPQPLFDLSLVNTDCVRVSREEIYNVNPHRFEFQMLDGIYFVDPANGNMAGFKDITDDQFWVRGHIPGRPIFPGVLMIETAAQLVSYYAMTQSPGKTGFLGFAGVDNVKFRGAVTPKGRIIMLGKMVELKPRRCIGETQAYLDGQLVYEGRITGMWI